MWLVDLERGQVWANGAAVELSGAARRDASDRLDAATAEMLEQAWRRAASGQSAVAHFEVAAGRRIPVSVKALNGGPPGCRRLLLEATNGEAGTAAPPPSRGERLLDLIRRFQDAADRQEHAAGFQAVLPELLELTGADEASVTDEGGGAPVLLASHRREPRAAEEPHVLCLPMRLRGAVMGNLTLASARPLDDALPQFLAPFLAVAAAAIGADRVRTHEETGDPARQVWGWAIGPDLRLTYLSPDAAALMSGGRAAPIGRALVDLMAPFDPFGSGYALREALEARRAFRDMILPLLHGDGVIRYLRLDGDPVRADDGSFHGFRGTATDVTDRLIAQSRLAALFDSAPIGIAIHAIDGDILAANSALHVLGKFAPGTLIGRNIWDFVQPEDAVDLRRRLQDLLAGRVDRITATVRAIVAQGRQIWVNVSCGLVRDPGGAPNCLATTVADVTDQRAAEDERVRLREQFHQAQKMDAIGRLAGGIAHDFNNILAAIMGYASIMAEEVEASGTARAYADQIVKAGERGKAIVRQLLTFSRPGHAERRRVQLETVVSDALHLVRATIPRTIRIDPPDGALPVTAMVDAVQIEQVVMNLSLNAAHAIGQNQGMIAVHVDLIDIAGGRAEQLRSRLGEASDIHHVEPDPSTGGGRLWIGLIREPGTHARITVQDNGCGMDAATLGKIFEPFYTTKSSGGTGIGLAAVRGIVAAHGGAICVSSHPGVGTIFEILLPLAAPVVRGSARPDAAPKPRERILVVDDEAEIVRIMTASLARLGYRVDGYTDPREALAAFAQAPETWDLIITDCVMPGLSGDALTEEVLRIRPNVKVVMCSGFSDRISDANARALGLSAFVLKPVVGRQLARVVRSALDGVTMAGAAS